MIPWRQITSLWFLAALALIALPETGAAKALRVASGDHGSFTRLVISSPKDASWRLGRTADGYQLQIDLPEAHFDTKGVFDLISRNRLDALGEGQRAGTLDLTLAPNCKCFASASALPGGEIVIDLANGSAPQGSPFEQPLDGEGPAAPDKQPAAQKEAATPLLHPGQLVPAPTLVVMAATISFRPKPNEEASLPIYWRNVLPDQGGDAPVAAPAAVAGPDLKGEPASVDIATAPELPPEQPVTETPPPSLEAGPAESAPLAVLPAHSAPAPSPSPAAPGEGLPLPAASADTIGMEEDIIRQLSRAAAQGLVRIDKPKVRDIAAPQQEPPIQTAPPTLQSVEDPSNHILFHAQTSVDRDSRDNPVARHMNDAGKLCPSDGQLALEAWGGEGDVPAAQMLTEAHFGLIGEFDHPDAQKVDRLARLYLHLGLGAEARQMMSSFGVTLKDADLLSDVAHLLDDEPIPADSPLHQMLECETSAALWAFLAAPDPAQASSVSLPAVLRGFSALPGPLREQLGRRLSDRLILLGAKDAAKQVRNAMSRNSRERSRNLRMLDAELALSGGHEATAARALDRLSTGNDELSHDALKLAIEARLHAGKAVDPKQADAVAAMAFENRDGPQGADFAYLEVAARAASENFAEAFAALDRWAIQSPGFPRAEMVRTAFDLLATKADDGTFLAQYYAHRDRLAEAGQDNGLTLKIAARLSDLGFADEVVTLLAGPAGQTDAGHVMLAKAAIGRFDPETALANLQGATGEDAAKLRARAYGQMGDPMAAATELNAAGAPEDAARAAWSAGDWQGAAAGSEIFKTAVTTLGLAPRSSPAVDSAVTGPSLSGSKAMLEESASLRATLATLLPPESPDATVPAATAAATAATTTPKTQ